MEEYSHTQVALVRKMYRDRIIGNKHVGELEVCRGLPNNLKTKIQNELKKLHKKGLVRIKKTNYGDQYSLEPKTIPKIIEILKNNKALD